MYLYGIEMLECSTNENVKMVLIVPLWNWNPIKILESESCLGVLIVPLWNWNIESSSGITKSDGSNCTFMELKFAKAFLAWA